MGRRGESSHSASSRDLSLVHHKLAIVQPDTRHLEEEKEEEEEEEGEEEEEEEEECEEEE